jgi:hypothetical protein
LTSFIDVLIYYNNIPCDELVCGDYNLPNNEMFDYCENNTIVSLKMKNPFYLGNKNKKFFLNICIVYHK